MRPFSNVAPFTLATVLAVCLPCVSSAQTKLDIRAPELGAVRWQRDFPAALEASKESGKPVFLLFQEIPGCLTCQNFGHNVLSHPLLVDAIENEFIPMVAYNNKPGVDSKILIRYKEPSGNNPVVRYVDGAGVDLIERKQFIWTAVGIAPRMIASLEAAKRPVPNYLKAAVAEADTKFHRKIWFAMHCYYEGEAKLGSLDGVIRTQAGTYKNFEVVEVIYDRREVSVEQLADKAKELDCTQAVFTASESEVKDIAKILGDGKASVIGGFVRAAADSEQKVSLYRSPYGSLPLTPMQATKVNAALRLKGDPKAWMSPQQVRLLARVEQAWPRARKDLESPRPPTDPYDLLEYRQMLDLTLDMLLGEVSSQPDAKTIKP